MTKLFNVIENKRYNELILKDINKSDKSYRLNITHSNKYSKLVNLEISLQYCKRTGFLK